MSEKKKLNFEELDKVAGGSFSAEASEWYNRNRDTILARVAAANAYGAFDVIVGEFIIKDTYQYSISEVKFMLKQHVGIDVDDLN